MKNLQFCFVCMQDFVLQQLFARQTVFCTFYRNVLSNVYSCFL